MKAINRTPGRKRGGKPLKKRKTCVGCSSEFVIASRSQRYCSNECRERCYTLRFSSKTKSSIFCDTRSWQAARSMIQENARNVFFRKSPNSKCHICDYDNHIEVCHIKSVSSFDDEDTMGEINNINNLVGLCPNHHWEFDNKIVSPIIQGIGQLHML